LKEKQKNWQKGEILKFKINDFIVYTKKVKIETDEKYPKPVKLSYSRSKVEEYDWAYKTREFSVFNGLGLLEKQENKYYEVIDDLFDFIDLVEVLKAFSSNKLNTNKEYNINNKFTAKTAQKNGDITLKILFTNYSYSLFLDKFECSSLAAKFLKILARCEAWQE